MYPICLETWFDVSSSEVRLVRDSKELINDIFSFKFEAQVEDGIYIPEATTLPRFDALD